MYKEGGELNHTLSVCLAWLLCRKGTKKLEHYKTNRYFCFNLQQCHSFG